MYVVKNLNQIHKYPIYLKNQLFFVNRTGWSNNKTNIVDIASKLYNKFSKVKKKCFFNLQFQFFGFLN